MSTIKHKDLGMNDKQRIAIVGHGFVGKAIEYGFNTVGVELMIIDLSSYTYG